MEISETKMILSTPLCLVLEACLCERPWHCIIPPKCIDFSFDSARNRYYFHPKNPHSLRPTAKHVPSRWNSSSKCGVLLKIALWTERSISGVVHAQGVRGVTAGGCLIPSIKLYFPFLSLPPPSSVPSTIIPMLNLVWAAALPSTTRVCTSWKCRPCSFSLIVVKLVANHHSLRC